MWAQNDAMQIPGRDWVGGRGNYGGPQAPPMQAMPMPIQAPPMAPPMQAMPSAPTQSGPMPQPNIGEALGRLFGKPAQMPGGWGGPSGMPIQGRGQGAPPIDPRFLQMIQGMMQQRGGGMQSMNGGGNQAPPMGNVLGNWRGQMNRSDIGNPNEGMGSPLFAQIMALKAQQGGR